MFPDLRLLISATVATFFLAATAGLYASLRITQDQIAARADARAEDSPITRIANTWPTPEPGRTAALRELARIAAYVPPIVARGEPKSVTDHSGVDVVPDAVQTTVPPVTETHSHAALSERPTQEVTGSTGIAAQPETGAVIQTDHPDIHGNIGETAALPKADAGAEKNIRRAVTPAVVAPRKKAAKGQRRKKITRAPEVFPDPLTTGYPLYLTVPVFN